MNIYCTAFSVILIAPYFIKKLISAENNTGFFQHKTQKIKFLYSKCYVFSVCTHYML